MDRVVGEAPPLRGRALRFVLVDELMGRPEMTVAEMVTVLEVEHGFDLGGRASKVISDALRWETGAGPLGRAVRLAGGCRRGVEAAVGRFEVAPQHVIASYCPLTADNR